MSTRIVSTEPPEKATSTVPFHRKISYSLTDTAGNLLYCVISSYLLYFYTDVFGLSIGIAGTLLFITRFIDAIDAPIWGILIDRTKSKYGQSRPYFLWLAVPFAVFMVLTFTTPNWSESGKIAYAAITYIIAGILYTGISTPITSILPNLSTNSNERVVLNSFRMVGGNVGFFIATTFTLPLVAFFGQGNDQKGFSLTLVLFGIMAIIMFFIAFADLRENAAVKTKSVPIAKSFTAIKRNWPWMLVVAANLCYWIGLNIRSATLIFYLQYNLDSKDLVPLINGLTSLQLISMVLIPFFARKLNKNTIMIIGLILAALGQVVILMGSTNLTLIIAGWIIGALGSGFACSMPFAMLSDTVDYGEWKNGIRASGFLTSIGSAFCIKAGSGIGGLLPAWVMGSTGYIAGKVQTPTALSGIQFSFIWLPFIVFLIGIIPMFFYKKFEKNEASIQQDLIARRS
ncbi:MFS transporter [Paenibacillus polymyxa]|uniref:MFS transporter n=1 Tax=Paenibacillus TaxID=44249 RepID=UPI00042E9C44|nr:MFS transporter [Paenibacillus polymyxa]AHM63930.1 sugar (glycoside-pentoside-hexuronide) transporter [Paenibacillus polymyxa SQR-21]MEE4580429.1 MFS transporter [Paenibacillus polymyxa]SEJ98888.1 sugar (Glycoside-Pentoside-Hexuronide) transporter [Paenibacillus polymyxa]